MDRINNVINSNIDEEEEEDEDDDVDCFSTDEFSSSDNDDNASPPTEPAPVLVQAKLPGCDPNLSACDQVLPVVTPPYESLNSGANNNSLTTTGTGSSGAYESIQLLDNDAEDHYDVAETVEEQGWDWQISYILDLHRAPYTLCRNFLYYFLFRNCAIPGGHGHASDDIGGGRPGDEQRRHL